MSQYCCDDYNGTAGTLNICSAHVPKDVTIVAQFLMSQGVSATVTRTVTVMRNASRMWLENGCTIQIHGLKPDLYGEKMWKPLKEQYRLTCAFLTIPGMYQGCIMNYIRPSSCACWKDRQQESNTMNKSS